MKVVTVDRILFEDTSPEMVLELEAQMQALTKPRPMSEAPRDGTVILVFVEKIPWALPCFFSAYSFKPGWKTIHSEERVEVEMLGWLPCPAYTGEAVE